MLLKFLNLLEEITLRFIVFSKRKITIELDSVKLLTAERIYRYFTDEDLEYRKIINKLFKNKNLNINDLSEETGITHKSLYRIKNGTVRLDNVKLYIVELLVSYYYIVLGE